MFARRQAAHEATVDEPISVTYAGVDVYEMPPNGQGITALIALNILKHFDLAAMEVGSAEYTHVLIEALRLAFADTLHYVADPRVTNVPIDELLSEAYAAERAALIDTETASEANTGAPFASSNTVYLCVVDGDGNAASFINSNYAGFGSGIVPQGCGFTLQNRGANFVLENDHPNVLAPGKRPYHTIIPGMAVKDGALWAPFGVMGGFMQPQGHVQVLSAMLNHGLGPQAALDAPRFCIDVLDDSKAPRTRSRVLVEDSMPAAVVERLRAMGHDVEVLSGLKRTTFGQGQVGS